MVATKSLDASVKKWVSKSTAAGPDYEAGVRAPKKDWGTESANAEGNYGTATQAAIADKRYGKGVKKVGTAGWQAKTIDKGPTRYGDGVGKSEAEMKSGLGPVLDTIGRTALPAKGPKGAPGNIQRVAAIATALHNAKVGKA